jgi:2-polyprenyl-3-methyl-5-hydroxy-6-metoxy-1,4-benzoquinol methylase
VNAYITRIIADAETSLCDDLSNLDQVFARLPLESYGELLLDVPEQWPRLRQLLPRMPDAQVQINWTGNHGKALLAQSVAFLRTVLSYVPSWRARERDLRALDFGCGWGRLLRLMTKYYPLTQLEGVDPWNKSIELCRECRIRNPLAISEYLPETLGTLNNEFDLIYAFSVFTHLSPYAADTCLRTLHKYLKRSGVLIATIRPLEYWHSVDRSEMAIAHERNGYAYLPHNFHVSNPYGEPIYGDISIEPEALERHGLKIAGIEHNMADPLQMIVVLRSGLSPGFIANDATSEREYERSC